MYKIFLISLFVSWSTASHKPIFRHDYKYREEVDGWIKLHKVPANWQDARLRCIAEGASLASPYSHNMRNIMVSVMLTLTSDPGIGIYSGIHSTFYNGSYSTIEGVPLSELSVKWAIGQPDHVYTDNCAVFLINGTLKGVQCDDAFQYICYKKYEPLKINKCNTVDNEYNFEEKTGHCYKFHRFGQTWSRAYMICAAEGGYLAIINNDTEAEVLKGLFAKFPKEQIFSKHPDSATIGFREWPDERLWYTVHGQTLKDAGYDKWSDGQPDTMVSEGEKQACGAIFRNALLDDSWCSQSEAFICEKNP